MLKMSRARRTATRAQVAALVLATALAATVTCVAAGPARHNSTNRPTQPRVSSDQTPPLAAGPSLTTLEEERAFERALADGSCFETPLGRAVRLGDSAFAVQNKSAIITIASKSAGASCPAGFSKLNADLNKGRGGNYVYICQKPASGFHANTLIGLTATKTGSCPTGFTRAGADINSGIGGDTVYLCNAVKSWATYRNPILGITRVCQNSSPTGSNLKCPHPTEIIPLDLHAGAGGNYMRACYLNWDSYRGVCGSSRFACSYPNEETGCVPDGSGCDADGYCKWPNPVPCGSQCCQL